MSVDINLHRVVEIRIEQTNELELSNDTSDVFYTRDFVFVQEDGTETIVNTFADKLTNLIPAFVDSEED